VGSTALINAANSADRIMTFPFYDPVSNDRGIVVVHRNVRAAERRTIARARRALYPASASGRGESGFG
jgi:hypothetical protein